MDHSEAYIQINDIYTGINLHGIGCTGVDTGDLLRYEHYAIAFAKKMRSFTSRSIRRMNRIRGPADD